jgi:hypothetical protein
VVRGWITICSCVAPLSLHTHHGVLQTSFPLQTADRRVDDTRHDISRLSQAQMPDRQTHITKLAVASRCESAWNRLKTATCVLD